MNLRNENILEKHYHFLKEKRLEENRNRKETICFIISFISFIYIVKSYIGIKLICALANTDHRYL